MQSGTIARPNQKVILKYILKNIILNKKEYRGHKVDYLAEFEVSYILLKCIYLLNTLKN